MKLTTARRKALEVLAIDGTARRSNFTSAYHDLVGPSFHRIDWRVADWLEAEGLAARWCGDDLIEITDAGREALR